MRRFLPLFMMLLLTLRGLLGDAMAMGSLPNVPPHQPAATTVTLDMPTHAAHHATLAADTGGSLHNTGTDHGSTHCAATTDSAPGCGGNHHSAPCAACGICHSVLSTPAVLAPPADLQAHAQPASGQSRFVSATLVQAIKPPIA